MKVKLLKKKKPKKTTVPAGSHELPINRLSVWRPGVWILAANGTHDVDLAPLCT